MTPNQKFRSHLVRLVLILAGAVAAASPVLAADTRPLKVDRAVTLNGQPVPAGDYRLAWKDRPNSDEVTVQVLAGKRIVASASAHAVRLDVASPYESFVYVPSTDGVRELVEIRFAGSHEAIRVDSPASAKLSGVTHESARR